MNALSSVVRLFKHRTLDPMGGPFHPPSETPTGSKAAPENELDMGPLPLVETKEHDGPITTDGDEPVPGPPHDTRPPTTEEPPSILDGTLDLRSKSATPDDSAILPPAYGGSGGFFSRIKPHLATIAVSAVTALAVSGLWTTGIVSETRTALTKIRTTLDDVRTMAKQVQQNTDTAQKAAVAVDASVAKATASEASAQASADAATNSAQAAGRRLASVTKYAEQVSKDATKATTAAASAERSAKSINVDDIRAELGKLRAESAGTDITQMRDAFRAELEKSRADAKREMAQLRSTLNKGEMIATARREALQIQVLSRRQQDQERKRLGSQ